LLYVLVARLSHDMLLFPGRPRLPLPASIEHVTRAAGLTQGWMMFAPDPPARDFVIVTDATTRSGHHFDPWRRETSGKPEPPLRHLPSSVVRSHAFTRYENFLSYTATAKLHPFFARWVLSQQLTPQDPVERFDAWLMVIMTDPRQVVPSDTLERTVGVMPLPFSDPLPIARFEARGVWTPERAFDRKIVPEATHAYTPVSATMSAGCPHLTLDLGHPRNIQSVYVQANASSRFLLDGSLDGNQFEPLAEIPKVSAQHHASRVIALPGRAVRFVRVRPSSSRAMTYMLSEIALFEHAIALPPLQSRPPSEAFFTSLERPSVLGIVSGSNHPSVDCPAEAAPQAKPP
jgi:hypothetical protein